ncbi:hypothetical protein RBH26_10455 [Natronolimnohabitans sp. A-GB9]|uniref:hypothetical protein n=1 Tax=Natronolimnohabitans sp. A-GB9 TaxID=3069757 RepID=UPI0027B4A6AB|nr:hypothetical protein [Natronolimnohabitans sp. A-GB9]MDQ2050903.1 hypothetical protein [Natronolimnohabitans sp. A-GB9]
MAPDRSPTFFDHVGRVVDRFDALLPFVVVPFGLSLLEFENVRRALDSAGGFSLNVEFAFPTPLLDLWSFADPPPATGRAGPSTGVPGDHGPTDPTGAPGSDITIETPVETIAMSLEGVGIELLTWLGLALLAYAAISAVVAAGYVGGIDRRLRGEPAAILECVVAYAPRLFLYHLVVFGAFVAVVPFLVVAPPLLLLAVPVVIVLGYLFYAVPFLFVVADAGFLEAFRRSAEFGLDGGSYFWFALWHVVAAAGISIVLSVLVSAGAVGFLLALFVASPAALVLTATTVSFVQALTDDGGETTSDRSRPGTASTSP